MNIHRLSKLNHNAIATLQRTNNFVWCDPPAIGEEPEYKNTLDLIHENQQAIDKLTAATLNTLQTLSTIRSFLIREPRTTMLTEYALAEIDQLIMKLQRLEHEE